MDQHLEILHGIVEAEREARANYEQAVQRQESFEADLKAKVEQLRQEYTQKAEAELAAFEASEKAETDKAIDDANNKLKADLSQAKASYEAQKDDYAQRIYEIVVNQHA